MRNSFRLAMGLVLVSSLTSCEKKEGSEPEEAKFTPQDSTSVRASVEKWRTSVLAKDLPGFGTSVTADAVLYPPNAASLTGRDAAVNFVKAYPTVTKFDITVDEVTGVGDVAYDRGTYMVTVQLPNNTTANEKGSFLSVFRRQADGSWAHSRVMWHSDEPAPAAPPPPPARKGK